MDQRSLTQLNTLHPIIRGEALTAWEHVQLSLPKNVQAIVVQGLRTFEESDKLYAQGRTTPGEIVTKAKAGQSYHNYGLAFDFAMVTDGKDDETVGPVWMMIVRVMKSYGFTWGGDFPEGFHDNPHFEKTYHHNWRELLALHQAGDFIPGTTYVKI